MRSRLRRNPSRSDLRHMQRRGPRVAPQPLDPFLLAWLWPDLFKELPSFERPKGVFGDGKFMPKDAQQQFFYGVQLPTAELYFPWVKPKNASMVMFMTIGGGGGGGGGFTAATGSAKGGGGGGGAAGSCRALYPAGVIPPTVYLYTGAGGAGGTGSGSAGSAGSRSLIVDYPNLNTGFYLSISDSTAAGGGAAGTAAGGQAGGSGAGAAALSQVPYSSLGLVVTTSGQGGGAGGALGANGGSIGFGAANILWSSGGGGGSSSAANAVGSGGSITQVGASWWGTQTTLVAGGTGVAGGPGNPGNNGLSSQGPANVPPPFYPLMSTGASGGGSSATAGAGGAGGSATGVGSGGGGGGAGVTGAKGGSGGPGLIIVVWW
jgi:hypothetical protein